MKSNNMIFIVFAVVLFFIASCTRNNQNANFGNTEMEKDVVSKEDLQFKKMCQDAGYEWMLMKSMQNGKFIKNSSECWGCMVEGIEHVCDKEKFMEIVK